MLDSSVLVPDGTRRDLQLAAQGELYVGLWSAWVIAEVNRVVMYRRAAERVTQGLPFTSAWAREVSLQAKLMMRLLLGTFVLVEPAPGSPPPWPQMRDEWDIPIWEAAFTGDAKFVVTNDMAHAPKPRPDGRRIYRGIEYVTAREFLRRVGYG